MMGAPPLAGLRVLDLSRLLPGPFCTLFLADFGAEVIMVEAVGRGDERRWLPPRHPTTGESYWRLLLNRGKQSIALDLKDPRGHAALLRLAEDAGVGLGGFPSRGIGRP